MLVLRFIGVLNAAVWLGAALFFTFAVGPAFFTDEVKSMQMLHPFWPGVMAGKAIFLGLRKDVPLCLRAADLFVLPSRYEAQGMALVEGMMAGLPVVASRVGGVPSLIEEGRTGLLVPPEDPAALSAAIRSLLADPKGANEMAERGRRFALENLGTDAMVARYLRLYAELAA